MYQIDFSKPNHVHFIGIGGSSMSGLAEYLLQKGFTVSGSDRDLNASTKKLEAHGAKILLGQSADNITNDIDLVIYTAAIHPDNPEYHAAEVAGIPMLSRAQFLGQMMAQHHDSFAVSGTHGKTTTTSMIAHILLEADTDPTISIGGKLDAIGGNIRKGDSDVFLVEACEYTNSFLELHPMYSIILDIEEDHPDFFKDLDDIRNSFRLFLENTHPEGAVILNSEIPDPEELTKNVDAKAVFYGLSGNEAYTARNITYDKNGFAAFTIVIDGKDAGEVQLRIPGEHNVANALAAIAATHQFGIAVEDMIRGLESFGGAIRRFQHRGVWNGVTIMDDYAHHPTEIRVTLEAARNVPHNRLIAVFQPFTYSRTKAYWQDFIDALSLADLVILPDVMAARETDTLGVRSEDLAADIMKAGTECYHVATFPEIEKFLEKNSMNNDLLITMGCGDVYRLADLLVGE